MRTHRPGRLATSRSRADRGRLAGRPITPLTPERDLRPVSASPAAAPCEPDLDLLAEVARDGYAPPNLDNRPIRARAQAEIALAVVERDPSAAVRLADQALAIDPEQRLALTVNAMGHLALEEDEPLEPVADALMRLAPERGWGALAHAARYLMKGLPDAASPWLRRAQLDRRPQFLQRVAALWFAAGRPAEAGKLFKQVRTMTPDDPAAHIGVGMAALAVRDYPSAEVALREALRLDPSRPTTYLQLAQLHAVTGRPAEAKRLAAAAALLGGDPTLAEAAERGGLGD